MRKVFFAFVGIVLLWSCNDKPMDKLGNVKYSRGGKPCETARRNHWLMDLEACDALDSVYLNTIQLGRKIEVHRLQLDSSSTLYTLLVQTCKGDSLKLHVSAKEFYTSMKGSVPAHLKSDDQITVYIWMRDKLTDAEHISYKKVYEKDAVRRYIDNQRWKGIRDSETGIVYEKLKSNSGPQPIKKAKVKYIIKSLNEQFIASSRGDRLLMFDASDKGILGGIRFLVSKLGLGESARAIVPSGMAYGASGNTRVPGYMPILLEVEIIEILE
jgi:FKBP-type peptidyl-prolyl cis-trans isomerase